MKSIDNDEASVVEADTSASDGVDLWCHDLLLLDVKLRNSELLDGDSGLAKGVWASKDWSLLFLIRLGGVDVVGVIHLLRYTSLEDSS